MVLLERVEDIAEAADLRGLIQRHAEYTGSEIAEHILNDWQNAIGHFVRIIPKDYKRMVEHIEKVEATGLTGDEALLAAFEASMRELARAGGN